MKISVIVPAYNCENLICETLDCLLNQTLKDIQIIIVNDGSTDGTAAVIDRYAKKDSRILSVYQENAGVSAARNNGIDRAEGEYLLFLDSDDLLSTNALERLTEKLDKTGADLAICRVQRFGYGGEEFNPIVDAFTKEEFLDCYDKRLLWNFLVSNKCYRTDWLRKNAIRFPPLRYSEDGVFFMSAVYKSPKITGVYDAVFKYRRRSPEEGFSVTQSINLNLVRDFNTSLETVYSLAEKSFESEACTCKNKEEYLQEILYKHYYTFINEFYRLIWKSDKETMAFIDEKCSGLLSKMTDETLKKVKNSNRDIVNPIFNKERTAASPFVSVIAKEVSPQFFTSLFNQVMPCFELITSKRIETPSENIVILPSKGFKKAAKKAAKGKITLNLSGRKAVDIRLLKVIVLLKNHRLFGRFPSFLICQGAKLFLKIKK
ncbi:MAG: glycosyltransferase family 2 protein [Clostridia bacterium]|nr:glycosyltransferase family 2 protein [Clostridia bacterium]